MKFDRLKGKGLLSNSHCFATRHSMILLNSSQPLKTVILPFLIIFVSLKKKFLKSQNRFSLILGRLLKSVVYDFAFNSILPYLVKFSILPLDLVISANQSFRCFLIVLGFYFLSIYMFCSLQREIRLLSINTNVLSISFSGEFQFIIL